jgi:hypothetical protein
MNNRTEILKPILTLFNKETAPHQEQLWKRFQKVRSAVLFALTSQQTPDMKREINALSWSGVDEGITGISGQIQNKNNGISVDLNLKGVFLAHQTWNLGINGSFTSKDGKKGIVQINIYRSNIEYEAYWLEIDNTTARLEQIIDGHGKVFNSDDLNSCPYDKSKVRIPGSEIEVLLYRKISL